MGYTIDDWDNGDSEKLRSAAQSLSETLTARRDRTAALGTAVFHLQVFADRLDDASSSDGMFNVTSEELQGLHKTVGYLERWHSAIGAHTVLSRVIKRGRKTLWCQQKWHNGYLASATIDDEHYRGLVAQDELASLLDAITEPDWGNPDELSQTFLCLFSMFSYYKLPLDITYRSRLGAFITTLKRPATHKNHPLLCASDGNTVRSVAPQVIAALEYLVSESNKNHSSIPDGCTDHVMQGMKRETAIAVLSCRIRSSTNSIPGMHVNDQFLITSKGLLRQLVAQPWITKLSTHRAVIVAWLIVLDKHKSQGAQKSHEYSPFVRLSPTLCKAGLNALKSLLRDHQDHTTFAETLHWLDDQRQTQESMPANPTAGVRSILPKPVTAPRTDQNPSIRQAQQSPNTSNSSRLQQSHHAHRQDTHAPHNVVMQGPPMPYVQPASAYADLRPVTSSAPQFPHRQLSGPTSSNQSALPNANGSQPSLQNPYTGSSASNHNMHARQFFDHPSNGGANNLGWGYF